jgi:type 1 glutamine amidotransferase
MNQKALILQDGWDGHEPKLVCGLFKKFLESENFEITIEENLEV